MPSKHGRKWRSKAPNRTDGQVDIERAPTTAELNEPKVGERNRESDALVPNCCSPPVLLTFFFITALLAGLLSESNYCYYLIGRVETVDRRTR